MVYDWGGISVKRPPSCSKVSSRTCESHVEQRCKDAFTYLFQYKCVFVSVCVCVVIPFILDVRLVDEPAGVTQEEGHTRLLHLPSTVLALTFIARRIQPFLSLVGREVEFCVPTN